MKPREPRWVRCVGLPSDTCLPDLERILELPVYCDYAATTPLAGEVLEAMRPYFAEAFANPASLYGPGARARNAVDEARDTIASLIGAAPEEIFFTSGGTEGDNWAVKGIARRSPEGRRHILTTPIEHSALLAPCETLAELGFDVEMLPVGADGLVDPEDVAKRLRTETALVSVMHANNEVGTVQPLAEIGAVCRERGVPFHTDAVQSFGRLPVDVRSMDLDLATFSAHKLYGPKGVGALYVRRGTRIGGFMEGGEQERGRRAGTLNVPGIVGFAAAAARACARRDAESTRLAGLRDRLISGIASEAAGATLSGHRTRRLPNNVHFCFDGLEGETLLLALDMDGVCASAGSACSAGSTEPSHVLLAMGIPIEKARGALRLTLGESTSEESVEYVVERVAANVRRLQSLGRTVAIT